MAQRSPTLPCSHMCRSWYITRPYQLPLREKIWERASAEIRYSGSAFLKPPWEPAGILLGIFHSPDPPAGRQGGPAAMPSRLPCGTWACLSHCAQAYPFLSLPQGKQEHTQQAQTLSVSQCIRTAQVLQKKTRWVEHMLYFKYSKLICIYCAAYTQAAAAYVGFLLPWRKPQHWPNPSPSAWEKF